MKLVQYNKYIPSTMDTDGLVPQSWLHIHDFPTAYGIRDGHL